MKKIVGVLAIIITCVSVFYMINVSGVAPKNNSQDMVERDNDLGKANINKEKNNETNEGIKDTDKDGKSRTIEESTNTSDANKNEKQDIENKDSKTQNKSNNTQGEEKDKNEVSVFKVDKTELIDKMSYGDKFELLKISKDLSSSDEAEIMQLIKSSNEYDASVKIFSILKKRLSDDDYNKIKEILYPYMDVEYIEKNMK